MTTHLTATADKIKNKRVAIVRIGGPETDSDGIRLGEYFQVTIDPENLSPSGEYIRFGNSQGDEIVGWQRAKYIQVVEFLDANETAGNGYVGDTGVTKLAGGA